MSELKKVLSGGLSRSNHNHLMDLVLTDVLNRHGISENRIKNLSDEQKQKIKRVAGEIQQQLEQLLK